jgi:TetR/AcrR family transcriptional regulator, regulator of cefoperazone and chloramphenicol sensitivity
VRKGSAVPKPKVPGGGERDTRARLVRAARELFCSRGCHATSVRDIAGRAGCNVSLIPYYFGSKDGLLREIIHAQLDATVQTVARHDDPRQPLERRIRGFVAAVVGHVDRNRELLQIVFRELMVADGRLAVDLVRRARENGLVFQELVEELHRDGRLRRLDPSTAAMLLFGMTLIYFLTYPVSSRVIGRCSPRLLRRLSDDIAEVFVAGALVRRPARRARGARKG